MPDKIEQADAEFRAFVIPRVNGGEIITDLARRIYGAMIEQERQRLLESQQECEQLRRLGSRQRDEIESLNYLADSVECLRDIGRLVGCGHVDDADGRRQLFNCVDQTLAQERQQADACRVDMVLAQDALRHQTLRGCQLYIENQRLRALLEDSCPTVNVNSEAKA